MPTGVKSIEEFYQFYPNNSERRLVDERILKRIGT
jgi:hypothetical protein